MFVEELLQITGSDGRRYSVHFERIQVISLGITKTSKDNPITRRGKFIPKEFENFYMKII